MNSESQVKDVVRLKYGEAATRAAQGSGNGCCGAAPGGGGRGAPCCRSAGDQS